MKKLPTVGGGDTPPPSPRSVATLPRKDCAPKCFGSLRHWCPPPNALTHGTPLFLSQIQVQQLTNPCADHAMLIKPLPVTVMPW